MIDPDWIRADEARDILSAHPDSIRTARYTGGELTICRLCDVGGHGHAHAYLRREVTTIAVLKKEAGLSLRNAFRVMVALREGKLDGILHRNCGILPSPLRPSDRNGT